MYHIIYFMVETVSAFSEECNKIQSKRHCFVAQPQTFADDTYFHYVDDSKMDYK